ncbi:MAG: N-acetyltransferase [Microbacteriaceae bacterium]|nr:N-acetyltransferase [Microbacteriaceae bacterium]
MASYTSESAAKLDGFFIEHRAAEHRFVLLHDQASAATEPAARSDEAAPSREEIGHARYHLIGDDAIDFNGTFVSPPYRGTGLSELLAHHIVTHEVTQGRRMQASCWYIEEYLARHPELTSDRA